MTQEQLEKAYEKALNDDAAAYLEERKFLNDTRYAQMLLKSYARKGYGTRRIKQELKKRGISNDDADEA